LRCKDLLRGPTKICSDGDMDAIFASAFLIRGLDLVGDLREILRFPRPDRLSGYVVGDSFAVELPLSKGVVYRGRVVLIDHHPEPARVEVYEGGRLVDRCVVGDVRSVASAVYIILRDSLDLPQIALNILRSIDNIDNAVYEAELDRWLHKAFFINKMDNSFRYLLVEYVLDDKWDKIVEWAKKQASIYDREVPRTVEKLVGRARELKPDVVYFTYDLEDKYESAALTPAMIRLEDKFSIVIAIGTRKNKAFSARIATKRDIDLAPIFHRLREQGISAGGRRNVGGAGFGGIPLDSAIEKLRKAIDK